MSALLTANDLTWMRAQQERILPGTVVVYRASLTENGMGGYRETWQAIGTATGRIYPINQRGAAEFVAGAQVISESKWAATLPVGTDVVAADRLKVGGRTWEVVKVNNDEDYMTAVRCDVIAHNEETRN